MEEARLADLGRPLPPKPEPRPKIMRRIPTLAERYGIRMEQRIPESALPEAAYKGRSIPEQEELPAAPAVEDSVEIITKAVEAKRPDPTPAQTVKPVHIKLQPKPIPDDDL